MLNTYTWMYVSSPVSYIAKSICINLGFFDSIPLTLSLSSSFSWSNLFLEFFFAIMKHGVWLPSEREGGLTYGQRDKRGTEREDEETQIWYRIANELKHDLNPNKAGLFEVLVWPGGGGGHYAPPPLRSWPRSGRSPRKFARMSSEVYRIIW